MRRCAATDKTLGQTLLTEIFAFKLAAARNVLGDVLLGLIGSLSWSFHFPRDRE